MADIEQKPSDGDAGGGTKQEIFYNVMPNELNLGPIVNATEGVVELPSEEPRPGILDYLKKYRLFVIAGVALIVIAGLGIFLYSHFSKPSGEEVVVNDPVEQTEGDAENETPEPEITTPPPYTTPKEWQTKFFGSDTCLQLSICGDEADPDHDGMNNLEEYNSNTDPNNNDSDSDGLADGDEVHVFGSSPLKVVTVEGETYTDSDYARGGYDIITKEKFTAARLAEIKTRINQYGFHQPTLSTLQDSAALIYGFGTPPAGGQDQTQDPSLDNTPQGRLDRDETRMSTIKKLGIALIKYKNDHKSFPTSTSFADMVLKVKPYNTVATNPVDPINKDQYTYTYQVSSDTQDFTLTYYSETQNQVIKYKAADAQKSAADEQAVLNDDLRSRDIESIRSALLIYSEANVAGGQDYVFPTLENYKPALVPKYLTEMPKDPKTRKDYEYSVSDTFNTFTIRAVLEKPPSGTTGYLCNQEECRNY